MITTTSSLLCPNPPKLPIVIGKKTLSPIKDNCCVCGAFAEGYPKVSVFSKSTGSATTLAPVPSDTICVHCAALWREPKKWGRSVLATSTQILFPTIAPDPTGKRPTWGQAIRKLDAQVPRVCLLTTDPKKRVWPNATVSQGDRLSLYLHDPSRGISEARAVSLNQWLRQLNVIEIIYSLGFSKQSIESNLLSDLRGVQRVGVQNTMKEENLLKDLRPTPEFIPALIIAQKGN